MEVKSVSYTHLDVYKRQMYSNMVAQLKQLKAEHVLDDAMRLIPKVRSDAGLVPLVTPTSQIVGSQAVSCALDKLKGNPEYLSLIHI